MIGDHPFETVAPGITRNCSHVYDDAQHNAAGELVCVEMTMCDRPVEEHEQ